MKLDWFYVRGRRQGLCWFHVTGRTLGWVDVGRYDAMLVPCRPHMMHVLVYVGPI